MPEEITHLFVLLYSLAMSKHDWISTEIPVLWNRGVELGNNYR